LLAAVVTLAPVATYLDEILRAHRAAAAADDRPMEELFAAAADAPPTRGFLSAIRSDPGLAVIAEVKRRSPSKGALAEDLDPAVVAAAYRDGGAACLSVLTDEDFFGGSVEDLATARRASGLPVLRKDFTVSERDVLDARIMGADCVLLIAAALDDDELASFAAVAAVVGLDVLVEVHDEAEVARALAAVELREDSGTGVAIGVNQRDLVTFRVDSQRAVRVGDAIPAGFVRVGESGVRGPDDAAALHAAGYDAVLVGEHLVTSGDPSASVAALRSTAPVNRGL